MFLRHHKDYAMSSSILHTYYYLAQAWTPAKKLNLLTFFHWLKIAVNGSRKFFDALLELMIPVNSNFEDDYWDRSHPPWSFLISLLHNNYVDDLYSYMKRQYYSWRWKEKGQMTWLGEGATETRLDNFSVNMTVAKKKNSPDALERTSEPSQILSRWTSRSQHKARSSPYGPCVAVLWAKTLPSRSQSEGD